MKEWLRYTNFLYREHADNETQCAELCCGGYTRLHEQNLIIEGKQSNTGEQYYCDAVMFSPSLGHLNCILLMCQLRNCTLEFQSVSQYFTLVFNSGIFSVCAPLQRWVHIICSELILYNHFAFRRVLSKRQWLSNFSTIWEHRARKNQR